MAALESLLGTKPLKPLGKERTKIDQQERLFNVPTDLSAGREGPGECDRQKLAARSLDPREICKDPSDANSCI